MTNAARKACQHELLELKREIDGLYFSVSEDWETSGVSSAHNGALDEALELVDAHLFPLTTRYARDEFAD